MAITNLNNGSDTVSKVKKKGRVLSLFIRMIDELKSIHNDIEFSLPG